MNRETIQNTHCDLLNAGRWANADVYTLHEDGTDWVVKDFSQCLPVVRYTVGGFMIHREFKVLKRLEGIEGIPQKVGLIDDFALYYEYLPGKTLMETPAEEIDADYFFKFEKLVKQMHRRNVVHLDIRYARNILVLDNGDPGILDFQSSVHTAFFPPMLKRFLRDIDRSGVYKNWLKRQPETIDDQRRYTLDIINSRRKFWRFKGYPMGTGNCALKGTSDETAPIHDKYQGSHV